MKALTVIISITTLLFVSSFKQDTNVDKLLNKQQTRNEVFQTILNNHEYMQEFMQDLKGNQHAMNMMGYSGQNGMYHGNMMGQNHMMGTGNSTGNRNMRSNQGYLMNRMMNNPESMRKFMNTMMDQYGQDSVFVNSMVNMMANHPQMMNQVMNRIHQDGTTKFYNNHGMHGSQMMHSQNN